MPPLIDRVLATPLAEPEDGVGDREGPRDGEVVVSVGSVDGRRPGVGAGGGFFAAVDITMLRCYGRIRRGTCFRSDRFPGGALASNNLAIFGAEAEKVTVNVV